MIYALCQAEIHWSSVGLFITSLLAVLVAFGATVVNYIFFRIQVDPDVIVYVQPDPDSPLILQIVIENIGKGLAADVKFRPSQPIPERVWDSDDQKQIIFISSGPIANGIPALAPGQKRVITWGQYGGLERHIGKDVIDVKIQFQSSRALGTDPKKFENTCPLEISSFEGTDASRNESAEKIANEVGKIRRSLDRLFSGHSRIDVEIVNGREKK